MGLEDALYIAQFLHKDVARGRVAGVTTVNDSMGYEYEFPPTFEVMSGDPRTFSDVSRDTTPCPPDSSTRGKEVTPSSLRSKSASIEVFSKDVKALPVRVLRTHYLTFFLDDIKDHRA